VTFKFYSFLEGKSKGFQNFFPDLYYCIPADPIVKETKALDYVYPVFMFISSFFIFLTLNVYLVLPDLRNGPFGKLMICFLVNAVIYYFFNGYSYSRSLSLTVQDLNQPICYFLAYTTYLTFLAMFFWMNAMTINITYKLTKLEAHKQGMSSNKFLLIILYGQGIPILLTIILALIDRYGACNGSIILPNIAKYNCFIGTDDTVPFLQSPKFLYFFLIVLILVIINIICFFHTGVFLTKQHAEAKSIKKTKSMKHLKLIMSLFFIMGVPWILDVISFFIGKGEHDQRIQNIEIVLDLVNLMSGLLIFIIFVCKKSTFDKLKLRIGNSRLGEMLNN